MVTAESTDELRTFIRYDNSGKSLMLNHMLKIHVDPINSITFLIARYLVYILGHLNCKDSNSLKCERQTSGVVSSDSVSSIRRNIKGLQEISWLSRTSSLHLTALTVTYLVTHLRVSIWPVEAAFDCLQGLGNATMASHWVIVESLKDEPFGVCKFEHHNAISFPP